MPFKLETNGVNCSPMILAISTSLFFMISSWEATVSFLLSTSFWRATFSDHPAFETSNAWDNSPSALLNRSNISRIRVSVIPSSSRVTIALPPFLSISARPPRKASIALTGSVSHCVANSSALMPETEANCSRLSPPFATDASSFDMNVDIDVPPASALIPTFAMAAPRAKIACSLNPAVAPAPLNLCASSMICDSVDAPSLPSATNAEPSLS